MPRKHLFTAILAVMFVCVAAQQAMAVMTYDVVIDSHSNYFLWDPSASKFVANTGVRFDLPAGTYSVTPKTLPAGQYNAWNGGAGYILSQYTVYIDETKTYKSVPAWDPSMYASSLAEAAAKIQSTDFTLTVPGFVQFGVADIYVADNGGSLYLEMKGGAAAATPIPAAVWLLGSGLAGLAALRRTFTA